MPAERIDVEALEIGGRYQVDWKHEELRRTFRLVGTLVSIEERDGDAHLLTFEVRPRLGNPALQHVDAATVQAIVLKAPPS